MWKLEKGVKNNITLTKEVYNVELQEFSSSSIFFVFYKKKILIFRKVNLSVFRKILRKSNLKKIYILK